MREHKITGGGGVQLHVDDAGVADGKPILFIHGFSQCRLAWSKQLASDLVRDCRLVAMDLRGHGLSEKPRDAYDDSRLWADDVNAVICTLGLDHPVLCGWSYGGVVISDYLRAYGDKQIAGINFVGAVTELGTPEGVPLIGEEFFTLTGGATSNDVGESVAAMSRFVRLCVDAEPPAADFYFFLGYNLVVPPYVRQGLLTRNLDNHAVLAKIRKPVLITHGNRDAVILPEAARRHADLIGHARVSWYPETGHSPFWEDARRFNSELHTFVNSL